MATRRGAYPGTFNPPTIAHLAVAEAARRQCGLGRVELIVSEAPLGKLDDPTVAPVDERLAVLERVAQPYQWLVVARTRSQLVADIAAPYDVVILGADKWAQVIDPAWYPDEAARDHAVHALPHVAVAPRPPHPTPAPSTRVTVLDIDPAHHEVSATAVRSGRRAWIAPGAEPDESRR
jgi:hypothetical protein